MEEDKDLSLEWEPAGRGMAKMTAKLGGSVLAVDTFHVGRRKSRERFTEQLCEGRPGIDREEVEGQLLSLAAASAEVADKKGQSQATMLVDLARECELWHTAEGDAYATMEIGQHCENWPVRSRGFKRYLSRRFYQKTESAPGSQALHDALNVIDGKAVYDGAEHPVHVRVAECGVNVYVDLCNAAWEAVEVTLAGWRVVANPPVRFRRAKAMLPLPNPVADGSIAHLRRFLNVSNDGWPLVIGWALGALRPSGPFPVLELHGEQGSAKSTAARVLRSLVDPNTAPLRCEPREPRDLMIAANNGWVIALDNVSRLGQWLSDAICRLATGGGFSTRTLYENDEETIFHAMRPVILTGIDELATRGDLLDRCLLLSLPTIPEERRRNEKDFWQDFDQARPAIFGAMLTAVSDALSKVSGTKLTKLPRMADFATWVTAGEKGLELRRGEFMATYTGNRQAGNELAVEASPVGKTVVELATSLQSWSGTATELLAELERFADDRTRNLKAWPHTPRTLSNTLRRLAPNLRELGVEVEFGSQGRGRSKRRCIAIINGPEPNVPSVPSVPNAEKHGSNGDDADGDGLCGDVAGTQLGIDANPYEATGGTHGDGGDASFPVCSNSPLSPKDEAALADFLAH